MRRVHPHSLVLLVLLLMLLPSLALAEQPQDTKPRVLILLSYDQKNPWTAAILEGLEAGLATADIQPELHIEYMDSKRHSPELLFPQLEELYRTKYGAMSFDLIILADNNAFDFLLPRRAVLFPDVPVVFCGVNNFSPNSIEGHEKVTGVVESSNLSETIQLALRLQPDTAHIAVLSDNSPTALAYRKELQSSIPDFADRVNFIDLFNQTEEELRQSLASLPKKSVLLLISFYRDRNGKKFTDQEQVQLIQESINLPIYALWDLYLGRGIVGGALSTGHSQGKDTALLTLRILAGEAPEQLPLLNTSPNIPMVDHRIMQHFELQLARLPQGATIINQPGSFYSDHRQIIWIAVFVLLLQALVITFLIHTMRRRRQAERQLLGQKGHLQDLVTQQTAELSAANTELLANLSLIRDSNEQWDRTFNSFTDIVTLQDTDLRIVKANQAACTTLDLPCDSIVGRHCYELFHGSSEICPDCPILETQKSFASYSREMHHEKLDKTFLVSAAPVLDGEGKLEYIAHVAKDITTWKRVEERLLLSEKMSSIAGLAAGVAHEINTPLSGILQSQQLIDMALDPDVPRNREMAKKHGLNFSALQAYFKEQELDFFMDGISSSALKASKIINSLLDFSRPQEGSFSIRDINALAVDALALAKSDYGLREKQDIVNVTIIEKYDRDLPLLNCVGMEIEQVLLNLIKNAVQAMAEHKGTAPVLTLRTLLTEDAVRIEVEDNGPGMDDSVEKQIFNPFFTTKEVGEGTGLGLSVSYTIICEKHHGKIWVESEPGQGSRFIVELPFSMNTIPETA